MTNLKISTRILLGFAALLVLLLTIALTTIIASLRTGSNIENVSISSGMQNSANELIHIINEARITSAVFYESHTKSSYDNLVKQLKYSDFRLSELYKYIDTHPELNIYRKEIDDFTVLYNQWHSGIDELAQSYNLEEPFTEYEFEKFSETANQLWRVNLLAHEILSNTIAALSDQNARKISDTRDFHSVALIIVYTVSAVSVIFAVALTIIITRSIMPPIIYMRDVLNQIGQTGNLVISDEMHSKLQFIAKNKDETAQCTSALLGLVGRLRVIDNLLSFVADGDLTAAVPLQSGSDTIGIAVQKMLENLNQKFGTIVQSTNWVKEKVRDLSTGSQLLSDGSKTQAESVEQLSDSITKIVEKIQKNTELAGQAAQLVEDIQFNAAAGTTQMEQMTQAATDINAASQSIAKIIKVIDDIAFQTNILALNAAVEAARAGQHGKGFSVVAEEVRNLATKSAEAAKNTGVMIENTIKKAALGATIAEATSASLGMIVMGVKESSDIINEITHLSRDQSGDIQQIKGNVEHVERIVIQNNLIATQSAEAAGDISNQSEMLSDLVEQFRLLENTSLRLNSSGRY